MSITGIVSFFTSSLQSYDCFMYAPIRSSSSGKSPGLGAMALYERYIGVSFI
jgi:hypothetical protein